MLSDEAMVQKTQGVVEASSAEYHFLWAENHYLRQPSWEWEEDPNGFGETVVHARGVQPMTCRDCRYLAVPTDRAGRRMVKSGIAYSCTEPAAAHLPPLPHSITQHLHFTWPPVGRSYMSASDGEGCPVYSRVGPPQAPNLRAVDGATAAAQLVPKDAIAETVAHMREQTTVLASEGAGFLIMRDPEDGSLRCWVDPRVVAGQRRHAVVLGTIGARRMYVNLTLDAAQARYAAAYGSPSDYVDEFDFTDEVECYDVFGEPQAKG